MEKFTFENRDGHRLAGRLELPPGDRRGVALFAHCFTCSKNVKAASNVSRALCARGLAVLRFDFTGLGNSEGDFANTDFSSNIEDLVDAAAALREQLDAPSLLVGHSLGGAAVLAAAPLLPEVRAVATIGAPSDPGHVVRLLDRHVDAIEARGEAEVELAGRRFRIRRQFLEDVRETSLLESLPDLKRALMIFHSPTDEIVGLENARKLYEAAKHPKSFVSLPDADHLLTRVADAELVADVLAAWAGRYLAFPAGARDAAADDATERGTVRVREEGEPLGQRITAGHHSLVADEPAEVGGGDRGPNPYDLLLAGLGACTSMTLRMYADRKKWSIGRITVTLSHERTHAKDCEDCESGASRIDRIVRGLRIEGPVDDEQRTRLLAIADRCPVHRTLQNEKQIETRWEGSG
jgi:putative redox protein